MARLHTMEDECIKCPELRLEDVKALREWAKMQPHLPNIDPIPDYYLSLFLRRRYYSLERAKHTLDEFLTFKTLAPELASNRRADGPEARNYFDIHCGGPLEKRDVDGNVVFFVSFRHNDPSNYSFDNAMKTWLMAADAWLAENGSANGITMVIDQNNFTIGHMLRISLASVKKMNYFNKHCAPMSIKKIYSLNATPLTQKILAFFQPLLDGDIFSKIQVFTSSQMDQFFKNIPKEHVPRECGGDGQSIKDLTQAMQKMIQRQDHFLRILDTLKVDETKRSGPQKNTNTMFGLEGTFKKLSVD